LRFYPIQDRQFFVSDNINFQIMKNLGFLVLLLALLVVQCQPANKETVSDTIESLNQAVAIKTGGVQVIPINTPKGEFKVWTKRIGNNPTTKVLLLHGGPGCTHEYWECFEDFLPNENIEFIYYDQLGSAYSDQPKDTSLWETERFVEELEQVRQALGLNKDNFYLLGHSWGGILAMEYALKYQDNLKGLIISNMMSSAPAYAKYAEEVLAAQLPKDVLDTIRMIEKNKDFSNPKYMELLLPHFYNQHVCRLPLDQWPDPMSRGLNKVNQEVYVTMQGPSEFGISGKLEKWDRSKDLQKIKTRTLVIGATHDTMDPKYMEWMSKQFPDGSFWLCPKGGHMCMWDDQQTYFKGLIGFLLGDKL
jgi:proline iminopeptidase